MKGQTYGTMPMAQDKRAPPAVDLFTAEAPGENEVTVSVQHHRYPPVAPAGRARGRRRTITRERIYL